MKKENNQIVSDLVWSNEKRKVNDLIPYERNPRKITEEQMDYLQTSLKKFNLVEVPTIDTDGTLVAGHMRTKALALIGRGEEMIDVRVPNRKLTPEEFKQLNIESNKLRGFFDFEMLGADFSQEELLDIGFSARELDMVDFPELEDIAFAKDNPDFDNLKYELLFANKEDYDSFLAIIRKIQQDFYPDKSLSDSLLTFLKNENRTDGQGA